MKRCSNSTTAFALLVLFCAQAQAGAAPQPGSPEAVVGDALDALNHGRVDEFAGAMDPDSLKEFRAALLASIEEAVQKVGEAKVLATFPQAKSLDDLKALDAKQLFGDVVRRMTSGEEAKEALAKTQIDVFGHISEGENTAHVVYQSKMKLGELDVVRMNVATLRKSGEAWKMTIPDDFAGPSKKGGPPGSLAIDLKATRVEPLGHLLDKDGSALIVYRSTTPVGDSSITKLAVMPLSARDPAFKAVRADKLAEVKTLLENRLGFHSTSAPATKNAAPAKSSTPRPGAIAKTSPRSASPPARSKSRKSQPSRASTSPTPSELPEGLVALPASFFGGDRDRFYDAAPAGGVLVGARVSYIPRFGGNKISSIQPIYRVGQKQVNGQRRGGLLGKETTAVAKPGYAVGALNTHTGLTVDGFEMVFMKIDGDQLDSSDSYTSPWLGDEKGGSPRDVSSEGKIPVGLQGRSGKEVNALGLIVKE